MVQTRGKKPSKPAGAGVRSARVARPAHTGGGAPDQRLLKEVYGIALVALAAVFAIAVLTTSTGPAGRAIAASLKGGFGLGAYFVPLVVMLWGVSFFLPRVELDEVKIGGGLALTFVAIIAMLAVSAPAGKEFHPSVVMEHGGYVGGALAWALRSLLGRAISYVLLGASALIGLVLTSAVSISRTLEWLQDRREARAEPAGTSMRSMPKTMPLEDISPDLDRALPVPAPSRPEKRARDPEAGRKTIPRADVVAPRASSGFELPPLAMLARTPESASVHKASEKELQTAADVIESTLATFDISSKVVGWVPGPTVTMFEVRIARGVKVNRVTALSDDLALALAASTIRILAPIPGRSLIGIEVPNERRTNVTLGDVLSAADLADPSPLLLAIGKDVTGASVTADLAAMPHMLIAGSTGTGKSVCINALLTSILMRSTPAEVRLILIDPKRIELSYYGGLPHLYVPVVTEAKQAASALAWSVSEMEARLKRLQKAGVRNISSFNALVHQGKAPEGEEAMPYLVIVIDELNDLMMIAAREVEDSICRLAQLARAAGIHLIVATQRPSTDIITGLIKTNITHRIAFAVSSGIDSRVILDTSGAEKLVGRGDMLFSTPEWPKPKRIQGALVTEEEIEAVVEHLKIQAEPEYHEEILHLKLASSGGGVDTGEEDEDPLLWDAADIIVTSGVGSTSMLQRRLKVGYARAGRIMDMLEAKGVVGPPDGSKARDVLVDVEDLESIRAFERSDGMGTEG